MPSHHQNPSLRRALDRPISSINLMEGVRKFLAELSDNEAAIPLPAPTIDLLFNLAQDQTELLEQMQQALVEFRMQDAAQLKARLKRSMDMTECLRTFAFDQARHAVKKGDTRFYIIVNQRYATTPDIRWLHPGNSIDGSVPVLADLSEEDCRVLLYFGGVEGDDGDNFSSGSEADGEEDHNPNTSSCTGQPQARAAPTDVRSPHHNATAHIPPPATTQQEPTSTANRPVVVVTRPDPSNRDLIVFQLADYEDEFERASEEEDLHFWATQADQDPLLVNAASDSANDTESDGTDDAKEIEIDMEMD